MFGSGFGSGYGGGFNQGFGYGHGYGHHHMHDYGFNRWGSMGMGYTSMPGYCMVDYSNGWSADYHDQLLRNNIDIVYQRYDRNFSGQLEGNEFFFAYRDLCLMMGLAPPQDYQSVWNAALACDMNRDGRISKLEMFMLFKRIQGINAGYIQSPIRALNIGWEELNVWQLYKWLGILNRLFILQKQQSSSFDNISSKIINDSSYFNFATLLYTPKFIRLNSFQISTYNIILIMWGSGFGGFGSGFGSGFNIQIGGHGHGHHHHHHHNHGFNRWGSMGMTYTTMPGYCVVDYSSGWNPNYHDQLLRNNIDIVYQRYDRNYSGQLEGNEFYFGYRDLCLMMGLAPPNDYQSVWNAMLSCDSNRDGRISKMEMFMLFKRIQGINAGYMY